MIKMGLPIIFWVFLVLPNPLTPTLSPMIYIFLKGQGSVLMGCSPFPLLKKIMIGGRVGVRGLRKQTSRGMALLVVLFIGTTILSSAAWLAQRSAWQTQGEQQRQNWQRARLVAYGGIQFIKFNLNSSAKLSIAAPKLPKAPIDPSDWDRYKAKLTPLQTASVSLPTDINLWVGYDTATKQGLSYSELHDKQGKVLSRVLCKQNI